MTRAKKKSRRQVAPSVGTVFTKARRRYEEAVSLALQANYRGASSIYEQLRDEDLPSSLRSLVLNDLASLAALEGRWEEATSILQESLAINPDSAVMQENIALLRSVFPKTDSSLVPSDSVAHARQVDRPLRIAIVSFLFVWPSRGGGIMHTVELASALLRRGFDVQHVFARYSPWGIGGVDSYLPLPSRAICFSEEQWNRHAIQEAFTKALEKIQPDCVLVTDSWNFKPWLAQAASNYPTFLMLQAQETLCPLNNIRLLPREDGNAGWRQCNKHQLATPGECLSCLGQRASQSGQLHRIERELSEVGTDAYQETLMRSYQQATAVLVMNPLVEAMVSPFCRETVVTPAAIDVDRFPWPTPSVARPKEWEDKTVLLFAGATEEPIKGLRVLLDAADLLWRRRKDFVVVVTGDAPSDQRPYLQSVGWKSQDEIPFVYMQSDICIVPSIAQESFGRVAAEAMGAGKPVVASRIGGLPFTVADEVTGLLFEPGNPFDLREKIDRLMSDASLRSRLGLAGRERFERLYTWDSVLDSKIIPLLEAVPKRTV
ncbi:glycosyltransferase [bacterium]|nr:glycosyltransferase [bacterium]